MSLKLIASELLWACPGYTQLYEVSYYGVGGDSPQSVHSRKREKTLYGDIHVPGEITESTLQFKAPVRLYVSANNPGAREVGEVLQQAMAGLELSTAPPPTATHFLLYLAHETFVGEAGERLADEVRSIMHWLPTGIVMLHENDMKNGGCDFARFFSTTPQDLIAGGLYKALAVAYYPGLFRPVSITQVAKNLGAVGGARSWRSSLHFGSAQKGGVEMAQVFQSQRSLRSSQRLPGLTKATEVGHDERQLAANTFAGISSSNSEIYVDEPEAKEAQVLQPSQPPPTSRHRCRQIG